MNSIARGPWVIAAGVLGLALAGGSMTIAAKSSVKPEPGGSQARPSQEASKPAKPKTPDTADPQPGIGTAAPSQQNPAPHDPTQIVEERLRRGEMEEPSHQGRISDRLEQFYQGSEGAGRQAAGQPDR
jgi:hypothetical protein